MDVPKIIAGRFRIECEIGTGGMGTVYRATQLGLERPVAVKIIKPEFASDPDVADRFMREARTMARLRHPHAAMIFDAGNLPDGRHFIIMEFVEGQTLSETLQTEGRFTPERAVRIASDICDVLEEAHRLGVVHRDLKPSNIMLNERGICVLDFGVAKVLATSADVTHTHATTGSGVIVGTPRYMSPEQCLGQRIGARSDLYSLGVLLYEMLTGRPPFTDPLASAVLVKQATALPPPLPKLRQDLPRALVIAVHTLLAKRPDDRPSNARAAQKLLEKSIVRPREMSDAQAPTIRAQKPPTTVRQEARATRHEFQDLAAPPTAKQRNTSSVVAVTVAATILLLALGGLGAWLLLRDNTSGGNLNGADAGANSARGSNANTGAMNATIPASTSGNMNTRPGVTPTPVASATPTPQRTPQTNDPSAARMEVSNALNGWRQTMINPSVDAHMSYYADTLHTYYNARDVGVSRVRANVARAFSTYSAFDVRITNLQINVEPSGETAVATFDKTFEFRNSEKRYAGSGLNRFWFEKIGGRWLITGEKDLKTYY